MLSSKIKAIKGGRVITKDSLRQDRINEILKSGSSQEKAKVQEMLALEKKISEVESKPWSQELEDREWKPLVSKRNAIEVELRIPNVFTGLFHNINKRR